MVRFVCAHEPFPPAHATSLENVSRTKNAQNLQKARRATMVLMPLSRRCRRARRPAGRDSADHATVAQGRQAGWARRSSRRFRGVHRGQRIGEAVQDGERGDASAQGEVAHDRPGTGCWCGNAGGLEGHRAEAKLRACRPNSVIQATFRRARRALSAQDVAR